MSGSAVWWGSQRGERSWSLDLERREWGRAKDVSGRTKRFRQGVEVQESQITGFEVLIRCGQNLCPSRWNGQN